MPNQWPPVTHSEGGRGPGSEAFGEIPSSGEPFCNVGADSELGPFKPGKFADLNDQGTERLGTAGDVDKALGEWAGVRSAGKSSSVTSHKNVTDIGRTGAVDYGGPTPNVQQLAPHSDSVSKSPKQD